MKWVSNLRGKFRLPESRGCWITIATLVLVIGIVLLWVLWDWLGGGKFEGEPSSEPRSATIRNIGFIIAGFVTLPLLIWRGVVADRQASAAQVQAQIAKEQARTAKEQAQIAKEQAQTAKEQVQTAQLSLLNERYQRAAEMLHAKDISVRLSGISELRHFATEHTEQYHIQVVERLCDFARHPTKDEDYEDKLAERNADPSQMSSPREDVQAVMDFVASRSETQLDLEKSHDFTLNLMASELSHIRIINANMSGAMLNDAKLFRATIVSVNLADAYLIRTIMNKATLHDVEFNGAGGWGIDLSGATVSLNDKPLFDLDYVNLSDAKLHRVDLSCRHVQNSILKSARIIDSNLTNTHFLDSDLSGSEFIRTDTSGAVFTRTNLSGTGLIGTDPP